MVKKRLTYRPSRDGQWLYLVHNMDHSASKCELILPDMNLSYICLAPALAANQIFKQVKLFITISVENYFSFCLSIHASYSSLKTGSDGVQLLSCWETRGKLLAGEKKTNKTGFLWNSVPQQIWLSLNLPSFSVRSKSLLLK